MGSDLRKAHTELLDETDNDALCRGRLKRTMHWWVGDELRDGMERDECTANSPTEGRRER